MASSPPSGGGSAPRLASHIAEMRDAIKSASPQAAGGPAKGPVGGSSGRARTVTLVSNVNGGDATAAHFAVKDAPLPRSFGLEEGAIIFRASFMSADPYMRGALRSDRPGGRAPGDALVGFMSGRVTGSRNAAYPVGALLGLRAALTSVQVLSAADLAATPVWRLDGVTDEAHLSAGIGALGMPGATAYGGLLDVLRPAAGETLLVTAASGAVGALVGQIAKHKFGCRVIGTTGGADKAAALTAELGFDAAIDWRAVGSERGALAAAIRATAGGAGTVDMVFEGVGGPFFEAAFDCLGAGGRIAVCGAISLYGGDAPAPPAVAINPMQMIYTAQRIEGFVCTPWLTGARGNFLKDMAAWIGEGWLKAEETTFDGIEAWPEAFASLFNGAHRGKVVVKML